MRKVFAQCLLAVFFFCACQNKQKQEILSPEEIAQKDSLALKIGLMPTIDCLPFYYAKEQGIYDSLHLDVRIKTYLAQMDCDTAFIGNTVQVCYTDLIRALVLQQKGTGLNVIMATNGSHQLISSPKSKISTIKNIKGKMIGLARHSVTDFLSDYMTTKARIDTADIFRPQINDLNIRTQMLENATLDAAFLPEPYATRTLQKGNRSIFDTSKDSIFLNAFIIRNEALNDSNRNIQLNKLITGYNMAVDQLNEQISSHTISKFLYLIDTPKQVADSIKVVPFKKAELPKKKQIRIAIDWLKSRNLIPSDYKDTLSSTMYMYNLQNR